MKLSKSLLLGISLATLSLSTFAADQAKQLTSAEKSTLATIAAIDKNEILLGIIAENKKVNSSVDDFAKMMIDQHGGNLTQILEIENQFKSDSLSSGEADMLAKQGKQDLMKLGALQGNDFSQAYADAMVKGHEAALKLINDKLMKTAKSEEVKKFLTDTRSAVENHLEHAKKLQEELK